MSGVKQDLTDEREASVQVADPEEAFLRMLQAEKGELPTPPVADDEPKPDSGEEPEEVEETVEEPEVPAEEESDDPAEPESDDLPEQEEEPPEEVEAVFDVQVNGETEQVSLEELQKGYSREADYTRQTQEIGEERRALTTDREAVQTERAKYDGMLGQLQEIIEQSLPQEPDWTKVRAETPDQYPVIYAEWTQRKGQLEKVQAERQRVWEQEAADRQKALTAGMEQERVKLQEALPDLYDAEKGQKLGADMLQTATGYGYSPDEVSAVLDSRALRLLHDATQYRLLRQKGKKVKTRAKRMPTVKPGSAAKGAPVRTKAREVESRLRKSGKVEDAAAIFLQDMRVKRSG